VENLEKQFFKVVCEAPKQATVMAATKGRCTIADEIRSRYELNTASSYLLRFFWPVKEWEKEESRARHGVNTSLLPDE
jgi:hypothetical protein